MEIIDQKKIKSQSIMQVCELLFNLPPLSRNEISKKSGLSLMTVGKMVELLKQLDIVYEMKGESSTVGRKGGKVYVNDKNKYIVIMDLSKINFSFSMMTIGGNTIERVLDFTYLIQNEYTGNLRESLCRFKDCMKVKYNEIIGIGVLTPGPYYAFEDIVINKRIPQLTNVPIKSIIADFYPDKVIWIDEDVKFAARYAMRYVKDFQHKTIFYSYIGDGVGGAIVQDMDIYRSAYSYSANWGQMRLLDAANVEDTVTIDNLVRLYPDDFENGRLKDSERFYQRHKEDVKLQNFITNTKSVILQCLNTIMWLLDPDAIIFDSMYADWFPGFFEELSLAFKEKAFAQRGEYIPELIRFFSTENAQYRGVRDFVRNHFLKMLQ